MAGRQTGVRTRFQANRVLTPVCLESPVIGVNRGAILRDDGAFGTQQSPETQKPGSDPGFTQTVF
jgi:hypothetical protein